MTPTRGALAPRGVLAFEERYAEHSELTVQEVHDLGLFGWTCDCSIDGCEGFQMLSLYDRLIAAGWSPPSVLGGFAAPGHPAEMKRPGASA